jgi:hypothetical protein
MCPDHFKRIREVRNRIFEAMCQEARVGGRTRCGGVYDAARGGSPGFPIAMMGPNPERTSAMTSSSVSCSGVSNTARTG